MSLPIRRMTLYKHGLGFFERGGRTSGEQVRLDFPRTAMDDLLKSLVVLDRLGQVLGLEFETPPDRNEDVHREGLALSPHASLTDTLTALRGRAVRVVTGAQTHEGLLLGVDLERQDRLERALLSLYQPQGRRVIRLQLDRLESLEILDEVAAGDLEFALAGARRDEDRASAVLRLSPGEHELSVSYIAPAPAWRVSYRVIADLAPEEEADVRDIFVQGWGLFDNTLEEDLEAVELSLMAGMPVSFRYALFAPNTPERPLIVDEERTVAAPVEYREMVAGSAPGVAAAPRMAKAYMSDLYDGALSDSLEASAPAAATGEGRGALFAYRVAHPVSVARGQSGMVPLLASRLKGRRELLYNPAKHPGNPVASLRLQNGSGLTLERGPATVLEGGEYAGEAVLDFTPAGAEMILAFAVELGMSVVEDVRTFLHTDRLSVEKGYLLIQDSRVRRTTYQITSRLEGGAVLTLEHALQAGHDLVQTPAPDERTLEAARWRVPVAARTTLDFVVQERELRNRYEQVRGLNFETLKGYLEARALDAQTYAALRGIRALYEQIETAENDLKQLGKESEKIYRRQGQIQGNLASLGQNGDEGRLRARLVRELDASEDRLREIGTESDDLRALMKKLEADAAAAIAALEGAD